MFGISTIKSSNKKIKIVGKKSEEEKKKDLAKATLKELNFPSDPVDILKLLGDRKQLDIVCRKLKLKAFW